MSDDSTTISAWGNCSLSDTNAWGEKTTRRSGGFLRSLMIPNFMSKKLLPKNTFYPYSFKVKFEEYFDAFGTNWFSVFCGRQSGVIHRPLINLDPAGHVNEYICACLLNSDSF